MSQDAKVDIDKIKTIRKTSINKNENALASYSLYMLKMLNGFCQMQMSEFHNYERNFLAKAIELFADYFVEQANCVLELSDTEKYKKQKLLYDIEEAVYQMQDVYKNVVDATSNLDENIYSSLPIDSNIYEISPKLYNYYTQILAVISNIFDADGRFAFLLHPIARNRIEVRRLFNEREKPGKIVLIFLPENKSNNYKEMPIYLMHEIFHILPRENRKFRLRAKNLLLNISGGIQRYLFDDLELSDSIQNIIMDIIFNFQNIAEMIRDSADDAADLHSKRFVKYLDGELQKQLLNALNNLGKILPRAIMNSAPDVNEKTYEQLLTVEEKMRSRILYLCSSNVIRRALNQCMRLYQECLADVCMIYAMPKLQPDEYEKAFEHILPYGKHDTDIHMERELRAYIVAKVASRMNDENSSLWSSFLKTKSAICVRAPERGRNSTEGNSTDALMKFSSSDIEGYCEYLTKCLNNIRESTEQCKSENWSRLHSLLELSCLQDVLNI